ncbi:WXG100 family type VII secretion target [Schaalia hyovaginalis]|uniref:Uncharacterized protein YukE n=1 Tax=Schaalia hyovaginalis TaxID=29316 RepID=A0A923E8J2_9ACTO|nr:hypothetical protein [Schaalia hyovaginalis]MBB6335506.1 uncharacterized protein YukE [Schaalia hyovaginalis]
MSVEEQGFIDTSITGDPQAIRDAASRLETLASAVNDLLLEETGLMTVPLDVWMGATATAYENVRMDVENATRELDTAIEDAAEVLRAFAAQIEYRREDMQDLMAHAAFEGFSIEVEKILAPDPLPEEPAASVNDPLDVQIVAAQAYEDLVRRWNEYPLLAAKRDDIVSRYQSWITRNFGEVSDTCFGSMLVEKVFTNLKETLDQPQQLIPDAVTQALDHRVSVVEDAVTARETAKIKARAGNPQKVVSAPELEAALERSTTLKKAAGLARGASEFATFAGAAFVAWDVATTEESPSAHLIGGALGLVAGAAAGSATGLALEGNVFAALGAGAVVASAANASGTNAYEQMMPLEWRDWFDESLRDQREAIGFAW